jgi:hypothetical protein
MSVRKLFEMRDQIDALDKSTAEKFEALQLLRKSATGWSRLDCFLSHYFARFVVLPLVRVVRRMIHRAIVDQDGIMP